MRRVTRGPNLRSEEPRAADAGVRTASTGADGSVSRERVPDLLHPGDDGCRLWAAGRARTLRQLLGAPCTSLAGNP